MEPAPPAGFAAVAREPIGDRLGQARTPCRLGGGEAGPILPRVAGNLAGEQLAMRFGFRGPEEGKG